MEHKALSAIRTTGTRNSNCGASVEGKTSSCITVFQFSHRQEEDIIAMQEAVMKNRKCYETEATVRNA